MAGIASLLALAPFALLLSESLKTPGRGRNKLNNSHVHSQQLSHLVGEEMSRLRDGLVVSLQASGDPLLKGAVFEVAAEELG